MKYLMLFWSGTTSCQTWRMFLNLYVYGVKD